MINGLAALVRQSGDYVDPLNSRAGIQGIENLLAPVWQGYIPRLQKNVEAPDNPAWSSPWIAGPNAVGGSSQNYVAGPTYDPRANYPGPQQIQWPVSRLQKNVEWGLGAFGVPTLTPGLHGMMMFPGSGGSEDDLRNPIHPQNTGLGGLGCGNTICDSCSRNGDGLHGIGDIIPPGPHRAGNFIGDATAVLAQMAQPILRPITAATGIPEFVFIWGGLGLAAYFLFMSGGGGGAHKR